MSPEENEVGDTEERPRLPPGFLWKNIRNIWRAVFITGGGLVYVCYWGLKFYFAPFVTRALAFVVAVVSIIEVFKDFDPVRNFLLSTVLRIHRQFVHPYLPDKPLHDFVAFMAPWWIPVFFVVTAVMALHHHTMMTRVSRSESLVGALRDSAVKAVEVLHGIRKDQDQAKKLERQKRLVQDALKQVTHVLAYHQGLGISFCLSWKYPWVRKNAFFASVWEHSQSDPQCLHLWCDYPDGAYSDLPTIPITSAAGSVLKEQKLLYVPMTYFLHGFLLSVPHGPKRLAARYDSFEFRENIFVPLSSTNKPASSITIKLAAIGGSQYILCVDSFKNDAFGEIDFQAACLFANIVGIALGE